MNLNEQNHGEYEQAALNEIDEQAEWKRVYDWICAVGSEHGKGGSFRLYGHIHKSAKGELCAVDGKLAAVRIAGKVRAFAAVSVDNPGALPALGRRIEIVGGVVQPMRQEVVSPRSAAGYRNQFCVSRNRAILAKAVQLASGFKGEMASGIDEVFGEEDDELQSWVTAIAMGSNSRLRNGQFQAFTYDAKRGEWQMRRHTGFITVWLSFKAPSPQEIADMINAQNACAKEARALARVGRRIKPAAHTEDAPAQRRSARL